jgi:choline dehydrogenase-like flavoprotein
MPRCSDAPGLASHAFPANVGVNPALTITALAERAMAVRS